jgi:hypothetical protein
MFDRIADRPGRRSLGYNPLKLTAFMCHYSGFPQSAAELFRLLVFESGTICLKKSLPIFRQRMKTFLFSSSYPDLII